MTCPYCKNDDQSMIEKLVTYKVIQGIVTKILGWRCDVCSKEWLHKDK